jgi:hypothetical protein
MRAVLPGSFRRWYAEEAIATSRAALADINAILEITHPPATLSTGTTHLRTEPAELLLDVEAASNRSGGRIADVHACHEQTKMIRLDVFTPLLQALRHRRVHAHAMARLAILQHLQQLG